MYKKMLDCIDLEDEKAKGEGKIKSQGITYVLIDYTPSTGQEKGLWKEDLKKFRIRWLLTDPRVSNFYSCVQCGACTSICTAASIDKSYNPRRLVQCLITGEI